MMVNQVNSLVYQRFAVLSTDNFLLSARWPGTLCLTISATQCLVMTSFQQHWRHTFFSKYQNM